MALAAVVVCLAALAAYGMASSDRIGAGTTVAGFDIGGMEARDAAPALQQHFAPVLQRPIVVRHGDRAFRLSRRQSHVRLDVDRIVGDALAESRAEDPLSRGARRVLKEVEPRELPLRVTYSPRAVAGLIARVKAAVDRPARSARVRFTGRRLRTIPARPGLRVRRAALARAIHARLAIGNPAGPAIPVAMRPTPPRRPTLADLRRGKRWLVGISRPRKELRLYRGLRLKHVYRIAVGSIGYQTPAGRYRVRTKVVDPVWSVPHSAWTGGLAGRHIPPGPENPLKARWIGIAEGAGIHGTADISSLGTAASHGCIRMSIPDVKALYRRVPLGTPIFIV